MKNLAIIPARGGSKRIPRKNIKDFCGKPIIAYSIEAAVRSALFSEIMVSTDDNEIAVVAKQYGALVPFMRNKSTANDFATLSDVMLEVLNEYQKQNMNFDNFCCILPTAPFITSDRLSEGYKKLYESNFDSVFPVLKFSYPIQRALQINDGKISMVCPEFLRSRSQDLIPRYHDSGQFYWLKTDKFLKYEKFFTDNSGAIILNDLEVQDIDSENDWNISELKHEILSLKRRNQ